MELEFEITRKDYIEFNKFFFIKYGLKKTIFIGFIILFFPLNLIIRDVLKNGVIRTENIILLLILPSLYSFFIYLRIKRTGKIPDENGVILGQKKIQIKESKIFFNNKNVEGNLDIKSVKKFGENTMYFFLFFEANSGFIFPKRAFKTKEEIDEFKLLFNIK